MNVLNLSALIPMEVEYSLDGNVNLTNNITNYFYGLNLYSTELFNFARDLSINYYNTFILTDKLDKPDFLTLSEPVTATYPKTISTTIQNVGLSSVGLGFWEDYAADYSATSTYGSCGEGVFSTGSIWNLGSWNMYDIEFLNANQCYISKLRNNNSILTQLQTKEYLGPAFTEDVNFLTFSTTPYIFNYIYNEQNNTIVFYFNYAPNGSSSSSLFLITQEENRVVLKSVDEYVISNLGLYNLSAVFCLSYRDANTRLAEFTTNYNAYKRTYYPTSETSICDSYAGLKNNYLVSSNVVFTDNKFLVNFQPLKNQLDLNYNFSITNSFVGQPFDNRDYQSIVSGTNQELGFPDLTLTFYTYNAPITFKKGALTYFHFPVSATPFNKLNINDSTLVDCGSFAGQNPLDADKVFKKLLPTVAGNNIDNNQTGTYLCTWLYISAFDSKPIWLDRYYNPNFTSLQTAFTQNFNSDFLDIITTLNAQNFTYFDKISDLTFEPNSTYSYYRLSEADIARINNNLYENQINSDAINVYDANLNLQQADATTFEYGFNTGSLVQKTSASGDFSICFNIKSKDFKKKFGNTLLNNFFNVNGLNITNYDNLNNLILFTSGSEIVVSDTNFNSLRNVKVLLEKSIFKTPDAILSIDFNNNVEGFYVTSVDTLSSNVGINLNVGPKTTDFYLSKLDKNFTTLNSLLLTSFSGGTYNFVSSNIDDTYYYALFNTFNTQVTAINQNYFMVKYPLSGIMLSQPMDNPVNLQLPRWGTVNGNNITYSDFTLFISTYNFTLSAGLPVYYLTDYANNSICSDINNRAWYVYNNILYHSVTDLGNLDGFNLTYLKDSSNSQTITNVTSDNEGNAYLISDNGKDSYLYKLDNNRKPIYFKALSSSFGTDTTKYLDILYVNNNGVIEPRPYVIYDPYQPSSLSARSFKEVNIFDASGNLIYIKPLEYETDTFNISYQNRKGLRRSLSNVEQVNNLFEVESNPIKFNYYVSDVAGDVEKITLRADLETLANQDLFLTFTFDSLTGGSKLYINSILVDESDTTNVKYSKTPISGTIALNSISLTDPAFESTQFKCQNLEMYGIKAFNRVLTRYDIRNLFIRSARITDINWNVPSGKRNITETIQQNFKFSLPGYKTNLFDIIVSGAQGLNEVQREAIAVKIREYIKGNIPINTIINEVNIRSNE
jgi:hypothetical protein